MKIGVMDSGFGGLTVVKEMKKKLPNESIVYFGDNKRCPYGNKETNEIKKYVDEIVEFLLKKGIHMLVIACNTVTALCLETLQKTLAIPVVGVIAPGAAHAVKETKRRRIGVIATKKTIESEAYTREIQAHSQAKMDVISMATPLLVPIIEKGEIQEVEKKIIKQSLSTMQRSDVDTLVLGCTHYPLIKELIQDAVGEQVTLIDPSIETTKIVQEILEKEHMFQTQKNEEDVFYTTGDVMLFQKQAETWLGEPLHIEQVALEKISI